MTFGLSPIHLKTRIHLPCSLALFLRKTVDIRNTLFLSFYYTLFPSFPSPLKYFPYHNLPFLNFMTKKAVFSLYFLCIKNHRYFLFYTPKLYLSFLCFLKPNPVNDIYIQQKNVRNFWKNEIQMKKGIISRQKKRREGNIQRKLTSPFLYWYIFVNLWFCYTFVCSGFFSLFSFAIAVFLFLIFTAGSYCIYVLWLWFIGLCFLYIYIVIYLVFLFSFRDYVYRLTYITHFLQEKLCYLCVFFSSSQFCLLLFTVYT